MITLNNRKLCNKCFAEIGSEPCPYCGYSGSTYRDDLNTLGLGSVLNKRYMIGGVLGRGGFGSAGENLFDLSFGGLNGGFVWIHDGEVLIWIAVGRSATGRTITVVGLNSPFGHVTKLHVSKASDVTGGDVSVEGTVERIKDVGVAAN